MIHHGHCLDVLKGIPDNTFHVCVTSPPYWSLRDYGVPPTVWGGDPKCDHEWESAGTAEGYAGKRKWQHSVNGRGEVNGHHLSNQVSTNGRGERQVSRKRSDDPEAWTQVEQGKFCTKCDAWLGCLGLEPTPALYVAHIVEVFEEVRRVLRPDGTLWLNIGDCYNTMSGSSHNVGLNERTGRASGQRKQEHPRPSFRRDRKPMGNAHHRAVATLKPKDLVGIPWMVAFALRDAGWYLRMDNIWAKTNPMPESIKDRPTKSHEYVFLLSKSESYFYDGDAVREGVTGTAHTRGKGVSPKSTNGRATKANKSFHAAVRNLVGSRNRRSVWTLPTAPFPGAHFATFPPRLVEPCIKAGTSEHGCCSVCGAPFKRIVKLGEALTEQQQASGADKQGTYHGQATKDYAGAKAQNPSAVKARILEGMRERITVGWRSTCSHTPPRD